MRVLVTGVTGQLGYDVCQTLARQGIPFTGVSSSECDIADERAVRSLFERVRPDAVIHCAAYTKVDLAEDEPERCWAVNVDGTRNIALVCRASGAKLLYVSTDYVFPGTGEQPYSPMSPTGPLNVYGRSKLAGELAVQSLLSRFFIVRISWVFGKNGGNFVKTMLRLGQTHDHVRVVCDQIGSPTYTADLAPLLCSMIQTDRYGIYHATNEGTCSWAEFAEAIFETAGLKVTVEPIPSSEYPVKACRPMNSRMDKACLDDAGFQRLPHWRDALQRFCKTIEER